MFLPCLETPCKAQEPAVKYGLQRSSPCPQLRWTSAGVSHLHWQMHRGGQPGTPDKIALARDRERESGAIAKDPRRANYPARLTSAVRDGAVRLAAIRSASGAQLTQRREQPPGARARCRGRTRPTPAPRPPPPAAATAPGRCCVCLPAKATPLRKRKISKCQFILT